MHAHLAHRLGRVESASGSQNVEVPRNLKRAGLRHVRRQRPRREHGSGREGDIGGGYQVDAAHPILLKNACEASTTKPKSRQRPDDEQVTPIPLRWIDDPARLGDFVYSMSARRTEVGRAKAGGGRGQATPTRNDELEQYRCGTHRSPRKRNILRLDFEARNAVLLENPERPFGNQDVAEPTPVEIAEARRAKERSEIPPYRASGGRVARIRWTSNALELAPVLKARRRTGRLKQPEGRGHGFALCLIIELSCC